MPVGFLQEATCGSVLGITAPEAVRLLPFAICGNKGIAGMLDALFQMFKRGIDLMVRGLRRGPRKDLIVILPL